MTYSVRPRANAELVAEMRRMVGAKNDAQLSRALCVPQPVISKIVHGKMPITASIILSLHEETGLHTREIKTRLGLGSDANPVYYHLQD